MKTRVTVFVAILLAALAALPDSRAGGAGGPDDAPQADKGPSEAEGRTLILAVDAVMATLAEQQALVRDTEARLEAELAQVAETKKRLQAERARQTQLEKRVADLGERITDYKARARKSKAVPKGK